MSIFLTLFLEFFKTGLFSIGGGLATLPFLFKMAQTHPDWFDAQQLTAMIAVSESTPGPIGINIATYAGFKVQGVPGAVWATLSLVLPSVIIILIIAKILEKFKDNKTVNSVFSGLRPAVVGMIAASVTTVFITTFYNAAAAVWTQVIDLRRAALFAVMLFLVFKFKKHPILYVLIGAAAGIIFSL